MKILIAGAGPAGCSAAYFLKKKYPESNIDIVEKNEIGGCSRTAFYDVIPYEFGPQIMYTDEAQLQAVFEKFLTQHPPKTYDNEYHQTLSVDGTLENIHDFPVTVSNVMKLPNATQVIFELYKINLDKPDFSNFENYIISRVGKTLYEMYIKNYNIKQWKIHPKDMDAEWAKFRSLSLREKPDLFCGKWQGHPGNYNPMWDGMVSGCNLIKGNVSISEDFCSVRVDEDSVDYDFVVSTLPLSTNLDFINTFIVYVIMESNENIMPTYATSFPNNYSFVRTLEYKQQFSIESNFSVVSFEYPWIGFLDEEKYIEEAIWFCKNILKKQIKDYFCSVREKTYPVSTKRNINLVKEKLTMTMKTNIIPIGRCGVHAYVSKDTCFRMSKIVSDGWEYFLDNDITGKENVYSKMREKLT